MYIILRQQIDKYLRDSRKSREMISLSSVAEDKDSLVITAGRTGESRADEEGLNKLREFVLKALDDAERALYQMKEVDGLSYAEIKDLAGLKAHLAGCRRCQAKLAQLREVDTFTFLTRPRSAKYQAKMKELIGRIKCDADKSAKHEIDSAAGDIYNFVKVYTDKRGDKKVAIPVVRKGTGFLDYPFYEAMGVLTSNEKILIAKDKDAKPAYLCLP